MENIRVGINGFGRIGRAFTRIALDKGIEVVAINTRSSSNEMLAYLLKYDSVYRAYNKNVEYSEGGISVDGKFIKSFSQGDPNQIPWEEAGVNVVVDATGAFMTDSELRAHLRGTVKKVLLTSPAKDPNVPVFILGCSDLNILGADIVSNASCTTNCVAPIVKVLDSNFGIDLGYITTAHAYTSTQTLLDDNNKKKTRSRAAALSIVPTSTGASDAITQVFPHLKGRIDGMALRVPVPVSSGVDFSVLLKRTVTKEEVNQKVKEASESYLRGVLGYEVEELVSSDYIGNPLSSIFDANYTNVLNGNFVKVYSWYDNEWGYSNRLVDVVTQMGNFMN